MDAGNEQPAPSRLVGKQDTQVPIQQNLPYLLFKYSIYALLAVNVAYFTYQSVGGIEYTYTNGMRWSDLIVAYAAPIDTAAWLVLLLILELETFRAQGRRLSGPGRQAIAALNAVCLIIIGYSFYGYLATMGIALGFAPYTGPDSCSLAGSDASFLVSLDRYIPLTPENCRILGDTAYYNPALNMFASDANMGKLNTLVRLDAVNAGAWILVVIILEMEVHMQASRFSGIRFYLASKWVKLLLYGILVVNAVWWGLLGTFWDAWDALLWLLAFFFIEMNILNWRPDLPARTVTASP